MSTTTYHFSEFENITRIQRALTGEAKWAVEDLLRTGSDPAEIMNALEQEFGHSNVLLECALSKIKGLPRVTESGSELSRFTSVVRNCVSILRNIKADGYVNNPQLINEVLCKLTSMHRAQYGEYVMKQYSENREDLRVSPNLDIVVQFLGYLSRASSYYMPINITPPLTTTTTSLSVYPHNADGRRVNPFAATGFQKAQSRESRPSTMTQHRVFVNAERSPDDVLKCALCAAGHELTECEKFYNLRSDDKWEVVRSNRLCFKCLSENHTRYKCQAKRCDKCRLSHHTLLHYMSAAVVAPARESSCDRAISLEPERVLDNELVMD